jgi:hypothetical protein
VQRRAGAPQTFATHCGAFDRIQGEIDAVTWRMSRLDALDGDARQGALDDARTLRLWLGRVALWPYGGRRAWN